MGNIISLNDKEKHVSALSLTNGLTSAFISTLVLSGSALAQTENEKGWVVWLAEHDQGVFGPGTVGFSISEMPWTVANFEKERAFLRAVIDGALARSGWDRLGHKPNEDSLFPALRKFREIGEAMKPSEINKQVHAEWVRDLVDYGVSPGFPTCGEHGVILHLGGCVICNEHQAVEQ